MRFFKDEDSNFFHSANPYLEGDYNAYEETFFGLIDGFVSSAQFVTIVKAAIEKCTLGATIIFLDHGFANFLPTPQFSISSGQFGGLMKHASGFSEKEFVFMVDGCHSFEFLRDAAKISGDAPWPYFNVAGVSTAPPGGKSWGTKVISGFDPITETQDFLLSCRIIGGQHVRRFVDVVADIDFDSSFEQYDNLMKQSAIGFNFHLHSLPNFRQKLIRNFYGSKKVSDQLLFTIRTPHEDDQTEEPEDLVFVDDSIPSKLSTEMFQQIRDYFNGVGVNSTSSDFFVDQPLQTKVLEERLLSIADNLLGSKNHFSVFRSNLNLQVIDAQTHSKLIHYLGVLLSSNLITIEQTSMCACLENLLLEFGEKFEEVLKSVFTEVSFN